MEEFDSTSCATEDALWMPGEEGRSIFLLAVSCLVTRGYVRRYSTVLGLAMLCRWTLLGDDSVLGNCRVLRSHMFSSTILYGSFRVRFTASLFKDLTKIDMIITSEKMALFVCELINRCKHTLDDIYVRCTNEDCPFYNIAPGSYTSHRYEQRSLEDTRLINAIKSCSGLRYIYILYI